MSETESTAQNRSWWDRYEKVVQWITLCTVVVGGILHYFLIDRPVVQIQQESRRLTQQLIEESKKNQQLLDQKLVEAQANTEALRTNVDQMREQIKLAQATVEQIQDPVRKTIDSLLVERQHLERVEIIDELIDSLVPNFQVKLKPDLFWQERVISFNFSLSNNGKRAIRVAQPRISIMVNSVANTQSPTPSSSDTDVDVCSAGFMSPGETINCGVTLRSEISFQGVPSILYEANFSARTDLPENSETWKTIRSVYAEPYLETRMTKTIHFSGELWR